jgi:L-ascorbate metabolism protein UlaG (beta-lactamase superfamily)
MAIVERLRPRWVVPMHYRTPRIGFLETEEAFVELAGQVQRLEGSAFDTDELDVGETAVVVVPAAP